MYTLINLYLRFLSKNL